jgi:integrase/recombinase XerC
MADAVVVDDPVGTGPLSRRIAAYLAALTARRYSPATVAGYAFDLRHLRECLGETEPAGLAGHDLRRALATLHARGMAPKTLARILSAWRGFFRYLARQGEVGANPCLGLRPPKGERKLPNALSVDQMARLLDAPADDVWAIRDLAMFELMYSSGLRRAELIGLNIGDIDLDAAQARVTGKGARTRVVPVAREPSMMDRWEMDLSPGTLISPRRRPPRPMPSRSRMGTRNSPTANSICSRTASPTACSGSA